MLYVDLGYRSLEVLLKTGPLLRETKHLIPQRLIMWLWVSSECLFLSYNYSIKFWDILFKIFCSIGGRQNIESFLKFLSYIEVTNSVGVRLSSLERLSEYSQNLESLRLGFIIVLVQTRRSSKWKYYTKINTIIIDYLYLQIALKIDFESVFLINHL